MMKKLRGLKEDRYNEDEHLAQMQFMQHMQVLMAMANFPH